MVNKGSHCPAITVSLNCVHALKKGFKQMKGLLSQEPCSVLVGNEANIIFDNLLDQYHMTTLLSLVKKCTNT